MTEVDVWRCALDVDAGALDRARRSLAPDELERATRLREPARRRAIAASSCLRAVLGRYAGVEPGSLVFARGGRGKPRLVGAEHGELRFSASRSGGLGVVAVTRGREVGVDVERLDRRRAIGQIADALFAECEAAELRTLAGDARVERFFELWTRKEAHAKALGVGLAMGLDRLGGASRRWSFVNVPVGADARCTVCVEGASPDLRVFDYEGSGAAGRLPAGAR